MKQRQSKNAFVGALTFLWLMALFVTVYAQQPAQDPLLAWLDRIAQLQLQRRETAEYGDEQTGKIEIHVLHLSLVLTTEREGGVPGMTKDLKYISLRQCPRSSTPSYCVMEIGDQGGFPCEK